ncbi:uncharacterized protein LOC144586620 [Pogona vitticeps]
MRKKKKKGMQLNTECGHDEKVGGILTCGAKMKMPTEVHKQDLNALLHVSAHLQLYSQARLDKECVPVLLPQGPTVMASTVDRSLFYISNSRIPHSTWPLTMLAVEFWGK